MNARSLFLIGIIFVLFGCQSDSVVTVRLSVNGPGYLILMKSFQKYYTRSGTFAISNDGTITYTNGEKLIGYIADSDGNVTGALEPFIYKGNASLVTSISVTNTGRLTINASDGSSTFLGQIALAEFASPINLLQVGKNSWQSTSESGAALIGAPNTGRLGFIQTGTLKASMQDITLDLDIDGAGDLRLDNGGSVAYSRSDQFAMDVHGFLVDSSGRKLTIYTADSNGNITNTLSDFHLGLYTGFTAPVATSDVILNANLDASSAIISGSFSAADPATFDHVVSVEAYDTLGNTHKLSVFFQKNAADMWSIFMNLDDSEIIPTNGLGGQSPRDSWEIMFDGIGDLLSARDPMGGSPADPFILTFEPVDPYNGAEKLTLALDISKLTQKNTGFNLISLTQNGYGFCSSSKLFVDEVGILTRSYTCDQTKVLKTYGQIALGIPGTEIFGAPGSNGFGRIYPDSIEM